MAVFVEGIREIYIRFNKQKQHEKNSFFVSIGSINDTFNECI